MMAMLKEWLSYFRVYKFNSLFLRNMLIIFLAIACPTVTLHTVMYNFSKNSALEYAYATNQEFCSTMRDITDSLIDEMRTLTILTSINPEVTSFMLLPTENKSRDAAFNDYIKNFLFVYDYLDSMYLYCDQNQKVITDDSMVTQLSDLEDRGWYDAYKKSTGEDLIIYFRTYRGVYPHYLTFVKPVYAAASSNVGAVVLNVDINKLYRSYTKRSRVTLHEFMVVDDSGRIIYDTDEKKISQHITEDEAALAYSAVGSMETESVKHGGESFVVSRQRSQAYSWEYYCAMPMDFYGGSLGGIVMTLLIMVIVSLLISVVISAYISKRIFTPIENIMKMLDDPSPWLSVEPEKSRNETDYILQKIASAKQANQTLMDERDKKVIILKRAQTMMLQLQINPHFLGNTLNAISWIAIEQTMGENKVSQAINRLANMFKAYSNTMDYMTDMQSEIEYTKQYIDILHFRYPDIFTVEWHVDQRIMDARIPRITLQPLVENAVYYGIKPGGRQGTVTISATMENSILTISVSDTGVGMSREQMEALNQEFLNDYVFFDEHIGLKNVNQRLKLIYGEDYGIHLEASPSGGVCVVLRLPYIFIQPGEGKPPYFDK